MDGRPTVIWKARMALVFAASLTLALTGECDPLSPPARGRTAAEALAELASVTARARFACDDQGAHNIGECAQLDDDLTYEEPAAQLARNVIAARAVFKTSCGREQSKGRCAAMLREAADRSRPRVD